MSITLSGMLADVLAQQMTDNMSADEFSDLTSSDYLGSEVGTPDMSGPSTAMSGSSLGKSLGKGMAMAGSLGGMPGAMLGSIGGTVAAKEPVGMVDAINDMATSLGSFAKDPSWSGLYNSIKDTARTVGYSIPGLGFLGTITSLISLGQNALNDITNQTNPFDYNIMDALLSQYGGYDYGYDSYGTGLGSGSGGYDGAGGVSGVGGSGMSDSGLGTGLGGGNDVGIGNDTSGSQGAF